MEQMDLEWAPEYARDARENLDSVPFVDLSAQLKAEENWKDRKAGGPVLRFSGFLAFWMLSSRRRYCNTSGEYSRRCERRAGGVSERYR